MSFSNAAISTRVPPQSIEAERAAMGAMLLGDDSGREAISKIVSTVKVEDFYRPAHQKIYSAIRSLFESGEKVDLVTIHDFLSKAGNVESAGGYSYLAGLLDEIPLVANAEEYARIIKEKSVMRRLMEVGSRLYGSASEDALPVDDLLNQTGQTLYEIAQQRFTGGMRPLHQLILPEIENLERLVARASSDPGMITGLPTGFPLLDQLTSGLQDGELIVIAARPGMGKTSFVLNIAEHVAVNKRIPVLIFSLEMTAHSLIMRMLCAHAGVDSQSLRRGQLFPEERSKLLQAAAVLNDMTIWIDDSSRMSPIELRAKARRVLGETRAQGALIIVDYLQEMDFGSESDRGRGMRPENRQQEIALISRSLKGVAKELNLPVVVVSQLSRALEKREGVKSKPRLSDLRESGAIEQDADVVVFLYRDPKYSSEDDEPTDDQQGYVTRVNVAKQRNGPTGAFQLYFQRSHTKFTPVDTHLMSEEE